MFLSLAATALGFAVSLSGVGAAGASASKTPSSTRAGSSPDPLAGLLPDPASASVVSRCESRGAKGKPVVYLKSWPVPEPADLRDPKAREMPEIENQLAIYRQLEAWASQGRLGQALASGCEQGSAKDAPVLGWTLDALTTQSTLPAFRDLPAHPAMKLKARFGDRIRLDCYEDEKLANQLELALSDAKGVMGFYAKLGEHRRDTETSRLFLDRVISLYGLGPRTTAEQAMKRLNRELKQAFRVIQRVGDRRVANLVAQVLEARGQPHPGAIAVIASNVNASLLRRSLSRARVPCLILQPKGYADDAERIMIDLDQYLAGIEAPDAPALR